MGKDRRSLEISRCFLKYINTPGTLNAVLREATEIAAEYANELKAFNQRFIVDNIDAIKTDQKDISAKMESTIKALSSQHEPITFQGFRNHFLYTFLTAIIAVFMGYILANPQSALKFIGDLFSAVRDHLFPISH